MSLAKYSFFTAISLTLLIVSGCATQVTTRVNAFRAPGPLDKNAEIVVVAETAEQGKSLEFQHYKSKVETALSKQGYIIAPESRAKYQAVLGYGVRRLEIQKDSGVQTGIITSGGRGRGGFGFGSSVVLLDDKSSAPVFERKVSLVISENNREAKRVYEVTGISEGNCGVLSEVFDDILAGVLHEFPATNGQLKIVKVPASSKCR